MTADGRANTPNVRSVSVLLAALEKIASPRRPDGTYNLSRAACEEIAVEALCAWEDLSDAGSDA